MAGKFVFRFEQVLGVRRLKEDQAARDLAIAQQAVREQNLAIARLGAEESQGKDELRGLRQSTLNIVRVRLQEGYLSALERRIRSALDRQQALAKVESEKRRALTEARKEVRVLERYRERQRRAWQVREDLAERKFLDEVSQNMVERPS
jgi:flagellar export protein FliJ